MTSPFFQRAYHWLRQQRRLVSMLLYGSVAGLSYLLAFVTRFEFQVPDAYLRVCLLTLPLLVGFRLIFSRILHLTASRWRFVSTSDVLRLAIATSIGSAAFYAAVSLASFEPAVPRSIILMEWVLTTFLTAGLWISYRTAFEQLRHRRSGWNGSAKRVLIVGAGEAANLLAREMIRFPTGYRPVGLVDDDQWKWGTALHGLPVLGSTADLPLIAVNEFVDEIIVAVPSATPSQLRQIVERCENTTIPFKLLPGIAEVLEGNVRVDQLREVRIEDLLGREPIQLELPELAEDLAECSVLVTGAAGSIGSELCRQVALHRPGTLVLMDQAETELFYLDLELKNRYPDLRIVSIIGDIVDEGAVEQVFRRFSPQRVFHAAAYKHVPMMEENGREAVRNNVIGTYRVAQAAGRHRAARFVLVSTDKAVRPSSMMGATKRLAEMVVIELQDQFPGTMYSGVRFGNVLGSSGSVIPIFKRQLQEGVPLTVTHRDATRYFMTIPEAAQLILQASLLPDLRGHVAMLDMGEPVRIIDLAKNLLRLSGIPHPNGDQMVFTGLRPGEKLHEELVAPDEATQRTSIPKVRLVSSPGVHSRPILQQIRSWEEALERGHESLIFKDLRRLFPGIAVQTVEPAGDAAVIEVAS